MLNLIVPLTTQKWGIQETLNVVNNSYNNQQIFVWILCEKNSAHFADVTMQKKLPENVCVDVFAANTTEDEMIFSAVKNLNGQNFAVVRSACGFFTAENLDKLIEVGQSADIAFFKSNNQAKTKIFFAEKIKTLCKKIFNIKFFDGNINFMFFSTRASTVLMETNVTAMTKINRWVCVEIKPIIANKIFTKPLKAPLKTKLLVFGFACVAVGLILLTIIFGILGKLNLLKILLLLGGFVLSMALCFHTVLRWFCFRRIGGLYCKKKTPVERRM